MHLTINLAPSKPKFLEKSILERFPKSEYSHGHNNVGKIRVFFRL
jgi:hypothetical protein